MKKKWIPLVVLLAMLSGCSLLPQEKQRPEAPILQKEPESGYTFTQVRRGTVTQSFAASAKVAALRTDEYSFGDALGEVSAVYVSLGSVVQEGDLLAELDTAELQNKLEDLQTDLACKQLELNLCREKNAIALERAKLLNQDTAALSRENAAKEALLRVQLEQLQEQVSNCQAQLESSALCTEISGVITKIGLDQRSFVVCDLQDCLFVIEKDKAGDFPVGTEVTLELDKVTETAVICAPSEVGMAEDGCVYVQPGLLSEGVTANSRASVSYIAAQAEDALYLPSTALRQVDGKPCVYLLDENGLITASPVEIGIVGNGSVQILSGLEEGQQVILSY